MSKEYVGATKYGITEFAVDFNLLYLIQKVTGHRSEQILTYFHSMADSMIRSYLESKSNLPFAVRKDLRWHYEDFDYLPYRLRASAINPEYHSRLNKDDGLLFHVSLSFPANSHHTDMTAAINSVIENSLGLEGAQPMEPFQAPKKKVPIGLKKIIHK